ncbi:class F sortase [Streptomyces sp. NPDC085460]|uniref:class F sortase n=1 Tax=Streptomyces sp. NPDC085460 TaxID=3365723 RepID=UPI0037D054C2
MAAVLVTGGVWWSGSGDPADPQPVAGADAKSDAAARAEARGPGQGDGATTSGAGPRTAAGDATRPGTDAARPGTDAAGSRADAARPGAHAAGPRTDAARPRTAPAGPAGARAARTPVSPPHAPLSRSRPTLVAVPAITTEAPVLDIGLDRQGRLDVPPVDDPQKVGWYAAGPAPGERGTAVVVGHRDTTTGPAVFLDLDSLGPGNTVRVARADGRVAVFTVDKVRTYPKSAFPDKEVYGPTGRPELRLLTCGGAYDRGAGYDANIVVFAHLTDVDTQI